MIIDLAFCDEYEYFKIVNWAAELFKQNSWRLRSDDTDPCDG